MSIFEGCGGSEGQAAAQSAGAERQSATPQAVLGDAAAPNSTQVGFVERAIIISVDGLGAVYLPGPMSRGQYPNLAALRKLGSSTFNARSDCDFTVTLPNHASMITGRPVAADPDLPPNAYHGWEWDSLLGPDDTLQNTNHPDLNYVASVFDLAHDYGKKTCMYAGKSKFSLYSTSYDAAHGAIDRMGVDNGRNKIDHVVINDYDTETLVSSAETDFANGVCDVVFFHIAESDLWGTRLVGVHPNG